MSTTPATLAAAREEFLAMVAGVRPELHRYCARLTGSVIEGEDVVQDVLAKAFYGMSQTVEVPPLRPWLFRIAHNAAVDVLRSRGRRKTEPALDVEEIAGYDDAPDPVVVRAALVRFLTLPLTQRSAVILKDVLGHSLEETAETMGTTVMAVKAALVRGRKTLRDEQRDEVTRSPEVVSELQRYATLFNAKDWDGVRALVAEDCRLDLVARSQRRGKEVGMYFGNYAKHDVRLRLGLLEGELALAAHIADAPTPAYFILLAFEEGKVVSIRDYRYVPYITVDAAFEEV